MDYSFFHFIIPRLSSVDRLKLHHRFHILARCLRIPCSLDSSGIASRLPFPRTQRRISRSSSSTGAPASGLSPRASCASSRSLLMAALRLRCLLPHPYHHPLLLSRAPACPRSPLTVRVCSLCATCFGGAPAWIASSAGTHSAHSTHRPPCLSRSSWNSSVMHYMCLFSHRDLILHVKHCFESSVIFSIFV